MTKLWLAVTSILVACKQAEIHVSVQVCNLIMEDRWLIVREIANDTETSDGSAHAIFTDDLGMRRVTMKFVPKLLSHEQQKLHLDILHDMLKCDNSDSGFLKTVIPGNMSWVYKYNPETKDQLSQ